jgi:SAM-dependent methyltransferase
MPVFRPAAAAAPDGDGIEPFPSGAVRIPQEPGHAHWEDVDGTRDPEWFVRFLEEKARVIGLAAENRPSERRGVLELPPGARLLDAGCGTGSETLKLAAMVGPSTRVVGLDRSQTLLRTARSRGGTSGGPQYVAGDIYRLPFADAIFGFCWARSVFEHLTEPARALGELARVLRSGARLLVHDPCWETLTVEGPDPVLSRQIIDGFRGSIGGAAYLAELASLFRAAGFDPVVARRVAHVETGHLSPGRLLVLRHVAEQAARDGAVSEEEARGWCAGVVERQAAGRGASSLIIQRVIGVKP